MGLLWANVEYLMAVKFHDVTQEPLKFNFVVYFAIFTLPCLEVVLKLCIFEEAKYQPILEWKYTGSQLFKWFAEWNYK